MDEKDRNHYELLAKLAEIGADVKAMHRRQDITNGRIAKNEEKVIELEKKDVTILASLGRVEEFIKTENEHEVRAQEKRDKWSSFTIERVIWVILILAVVVLAKTGVINLNQDPIVPAQQTQTQAKN